MRLSAGSGGAKRQVFFFWTSIEAHSRCVCLLRVLRVSGGLQATVVRNVKFYKTELGFTKLTVARMMHQFCFFFFAAALLLLYCCFTAVLLLLCCYFTAALRTRVRNFTLEVAPAS